VTFSVPDGWEGQHDYVDGLKIQELGGQINFAVHDGIIVATLQEGLTGGCIDNAAKSTLLGAAPRDLMTFLQASQYLTVQAPVPIVVGGRTGLSTQVSVKRLPRCTIGPDSVWLFVVGALQGSQDQYRIDQGTIVQVTAVDVGGKTVTILAGGPSGPTLSPFLAEAQTVVDGMQFTAP